MKASLYYVFRLDNTRDQSRSITELPESITALLECPKPCSKPASPVYRTFRLFTEDKHHKLPIMVSLQDFAWLLARNFTRIPIRQVSQDEVELEEQSTLSITSAAREQRARCAHVPDSVWLGYNSLISNTLRVTRIGTPPLIAAPVYEWQTLLTVLKQA